MLVYTYTFLSHQDFLNCGCFVTSYSREVRFSLVCITLATFSRKPPHSESNADTLPESPLPDLEMRSSDSKSSIDSNMAESSPSGFAHSSVHKNTILPGLHLKIFVDPFFYIIKIRAFCDIIYPYFSQIYLPRGKSFLPCKTITTCLKGLMGFSRGIKTLLKIIPELFFKKKVLKLQFWVLRC